MVLADISTGVLADSAAAAVRRQSQELQIRAVAAVGREALEALLEETAVLGLWS